MIDLYRFFENPFDDEAFSISDLTKYGDAHLAAMIANNPAGQLNTQITNTGNLLISLGSTGATETVKLGLQKAATQVKEEFRANLPNELSKLHGAALARYGRRSPVMLEIFPGGLEIYHGANDDELEDLLDALATALEARTDDLTGAPGTQAEALRSTWSGYYGALHTAKAGRGSAAEMRRTAGQALRAQFFTNLRRLVDLFPGQPEKAALYCPQHLLDAPPSPVTPGNPPEG